MKNQPARKKLEKAYFEMLEKVHYSEISVSDIIRKTDISRTTFYRYYTDIFDMHKKIADRLASSVIESCTEVVMLSRKADDYFDEIVKIFNTQEKYIVLISGEHGSRYFFESMLRCAENYFMNRSITFTEEQLFRLRFMTVAMVGVYVRDLLENREHNPEYIEICKKLMYNDLAFGGHYEKRD